MPLPKLLKKISRKNLRSSSDESSELDVPPLPQTKYINDYDASYLSFPSQRSSPTGSSRHRNDFDRSASDFGTYEAPSRNYGQDYHGRQPSQNNYVENLPSRHPSYASSEYSRPRTNSQATSPGR